MRRRWVYFAGLGLTLAGASGFVLAQGTAAPAAKPAEKAPDKRTGLITIRNSPQGTAVYDDRQGVARMTRDVRVTQDGEDFILYADDLTFNRIKNQAVATGNVRLETRDSTLKGQRFFADFNEKMIVITDNVTISSHGEGDGITGNKTGMRAELAHKPSKLNCKRVDWDYENRQGVVTGNIRMTQAKNTGTCDRIDFDEDRNVARLQGNVVFVDNETSRTIKTPELNVFIDEDRVQTDKRTQIVMSNKPQANATPRPVRPPAYVPPAPEGISPEALRQFESAPPPVPTPKPEAPEESAAPAKAPEPKTGN